MDRPHNQDTNRWPFTLRTESCDPTVFDSELYRERWNRQTSRLFSSPCDTRIKIVDDRKQEWTFPDEASFLEGFPSSAGSVNGLRVILIPQMGSWGRLMISDACIETLLTHLEAFPPVFDVIEAFGQRIGPSNESLGGIQVQRRPKGIEASFLLKHVELHGREDQSDPWSIRQIGVHMNVDENGHGSVIIINPSRSFQHRLKSLKGFELGNVLSLLLSSAASQWRSHINDLEADFEELKKKANDAAVSSTEGMGRSMTIEFGDTQRMRVIGDKVLRIDHILDNNLHVIRRLGGLKELRIASAADSSMHCFFEAETNLQKSRVSSLLKRMNSSSELMQNIIAARGLNALQDGSHTTTGIMRLAQQDNKLMLKFSKKAQHDARVLRTITILTAIYLPASFAAQVLDMGYVSVHKDGSNISLHFKGEMAVFAVLSLLLLVITGGTWAAYEWSKRKQRGEDDDSPGHTRSEVRVDAKEPV